MHAIPESDAARDGAALTKVSALKETDKLAALFALPVYKGVDTRAASLGDWYVLTITQQGMVKKSALSELPGASADTFTLVRNIIGDCAWNGNPLQRGGCATDGTGGGRCDGNEAPGWR
jgi:hypothetical protein